MKNKIVNLTFKILMLICVLSFLYSGYRIIDWYISNKKNAQIKEEISKAITIEEPKENGSNDVVYNVDFKALKAKNSDTVAYLKVNNTNIDYVVVRALNNEYYLYHNFNREYNISGWVFMDYKNKLDGTDKNIIIYGHNTKDDSMFGSLKNTLNEEWYENEENQIITLVTENETIKYQIFSIYIVNKEDYYIKTQFDDYLKFLDTIKSRSIKKFDVLLYEEDSILTLSTCSSGESKRLVVHAKRLKEEA